MFFFVTDVRKLHDSLEKLYNASTISYNGTGPGTPATAAATLKNDIRCLLDVLKCPVFESILNVQVNKLYFVMFFDLLY